MEKKKDETQPRKEITVQVTKRHKIRTNVRAGDGEKVDVVTVK
ncbi:MAG TPA: hypothetical protein VNO30_46220 [Kofleriaceae bacterium]|nr:hypothetical protein [Kofleriaceae bacterium]